MIPRQSQTIHAHGPNRMTQDHFYSLLMITTYDNKFYKIGRSSSGPVHNTYNPPYFLCHTATFLFIKYLVNGRHIPASKMNPSSNSIVVVANLGLISICANNSSTWSKEIDTDSLVLTCEGEHLHSLLKLSTCTHFWRWAPMTQLPCSADYLWYLTRWKLMPPIWYFFSAFSASSPTQSTKSS
jgi:hypothetical protein